MTKIYYLEIDEKIKNVDQNFLLSKISKQRKNIVNRKKRILDRYQMILGEILVKFVLQEEYGVNIKKLEFFKGKYGKPFTNVPVKFNISHSKNIILAAFSMKSDIGIDIEEVKDLSIIFFKNIFLEDEFKYILKKNKEEQIYTFYEYWTLKESYLKYLGTGLYRDMNTFGFTFGDTIQLKDQIDLYNSDSIKFIIGNIENYIYSLCCEKNEVIQKCKRIKLEQILNKI